MAQQEIILNGREDGRTHRRTFLFRVNLEQLAEQQKGVILTFDDITELQSAQRKAAWSDVARRIAHEIKNPLTPIQLSAERLKRKYLGQIVEDKETFTTCTETIIRHVEDIGRMVDEFSSFARMPEPNLKELSLIREIRNALVLPQQAHSDIRITLTENLPEAQAQADLDAVQLRQVMNNLIQNSVDSIRTRMETDRAIKPEIRILISGNDENEALVTITDNGVGLPPDEAPERLTEPYVTHKTKGTGLGLAIVKKIMEDHRGALTLGTTAELKNIKDWTPLGGATVILTFPLKEKNMQPARKEVA